MADQGCPGEGPDTRILGRVTCALERALSFHSKTEPLGILIAFPFFLAIVLPLPRGRYFVMRAGFRYDVNWGGYIFPEAAIKILDHPEYY